MILVHAFFALIYSGMALLVVFIATPGCDDVLAQARAEVRQEHALAMDQITADLAVNYKLQAKTLHDLEIQKNIALESSVALLECRGL